MSEDEAARLFRAALEQAPTERAAFLDRACGGDPTLRSAVEELLAAQDPLVPTEVVGTAPGGAHEEQPGRRIGPYRLLGLIGQGGMGAVYRAVREDAFEKVVALKLLRAGFANEASRGQFETERRLLARLEHAYIARLYDGGTGPDGSPYLVMEYVDGLPIQLYCAERGLDVRARLELFEKVCEAVQHAHRSLIVHRDIKPGNLLVAADGTPKLLDFGIAKLLPDPSADPAHVPTATVYQALTPDYASPEQVRGEAVTVTSDVYSLGVLLYELLAGRRPYQILRLDPYEIARVVCEQDPPRPSEAAQPPEARRLEGDLDAIVMRALSKEPARRYPSVRDLAEDLRRHLDGRPVQARPDTFAYRAGKFVRRRRGLIAASALLALALIGGVLATLHQARKAEAHRERAERRFGEVRSLAKALLFDIYDSVESLAGATRARQAIVTHGLRYLDSLAREVQDDPALQQELASAYVRLGDVQGYPYFANLGDLDGALASYAKAVALQQTLLQTRPADAELRRALLVSHERLTDTLSAAGRTAQALAHARLSLDLSEALLAEAPGDAARQRTCFISRLKMGEMLLASGDRAAAAQRFEQARDAARRLPLSVPSARRDLSVAENKLGDLRLAEGNGSAALERYRAGLELREALLRADPHNGAARRDVSVSLGKLGEAQLALGQVPAALSSLRASLAHDEALAQADPANVDAQLDLAASLGSLAEVFERAGQRASALGHAQRSLLVLEALSRAQPGSAVVRLDLALELYRIAGLKAAAGDRAAAGQAFGRAQQQARELVTSDPGNSEARATLGKGCVESHEKLERARAVPAGTGACPAG